MTPLLRKELRDQRPFALLGLFFVVLELLSDLFLVDPVRQTLAVTFDPKFKASGDLAGITAVIAFAIGAGLLIREQDDRTLEFLESMPVSRLHIFTVKVAVALGITLIYPVVDTLYLFLCHGLSTTSLDRGLHLDVLGMGLGLRVAQVFILLSLAVALAHFRRLYWLLIGVMFSAFNLARDRMPGLELLNPFALAAPRFEGTRWKFPAEALGWQLLVGGVLMALSLGLFLGMGEQLLRRIDGKTRGSVVGGLVTVATVGVCLFTLVRLMDDPDDSNKAPGGAKPAYTFETAKPTHTQTARYRFTYASNQKKRAEQVVERADAVFDTVRT
ncbi:MAG TPA: ABC transporter permease, partial [Myxococcaceae bacterium]|nr:ABC transporter permease [Myxococcaceae bacterium]